MKLQPDPELPAEEKHHEVRAEQWDREDWACQIKQAFSSSVTTVSGEGKSSPNRPVSQPKQNPLPRTATPSDLGFPEK